MPSCRNSRVLVLVLALLLGAGAGCSSKRANLAPVKGAVTYRGDPLPNALVVFMPETPDMMPATGLTDSQGHFELTTFVQGDGASLGKHRVTVTARAPEKVNPDNPFSAVPGPPLIPTRYFNPETSGLTAEVKAGANTADFALTEK